MGQLISFIRWARFTYRGGRLLTKCLQVDNPTNLSEAIDNYQKALTLCPPGHPLRPASLNNLGHTTFVRYQREGDLDDLTRAIQYHEEARDLWPPNDVIMLPMSLNNLAIAVQARYQHAGDLDDLALCILNYQAALDRVPPRHRLRRMVLNNLAHALRARYQHEGDLEDLTYAIQYHGEVLDLHPPGDPDRPVALGSLALTVFTRYQREGDLDDLTHVIRYCQEALDSCPPGHPERPHSLNNLAGTIHNRYEMEGNLDDLDSAIQYHQEALNLRPPGHPERHHSMGNLAMAMKARFEREGNLHDLNRAIQYLQELLDTFPPEHPDRLSSLDYMASAIQTRYQKEGNLDDLNRAIQYREEQMDLCPPGHPGRSDCLRNLAEALHSQSSSTKSVGHSVNFASLDLRADTFEPLEHVDYISPEYDPRDSSGRRIISLLREASESAICSPRHCLKAALVWVEISKDLAPEWTLEAYTSALDQLNLALAIAQSLNQRHNRLLSDSTFADTKDLGVDAASWALQRGNIERAVELLEQGRSLLFAQIGRYRVELDDLRLVHPELADRFAYLSQLLDTSIVSNQNLEEGSLRVKDPHERYRKVSTEWTQTVDKIRCLPGFELFLKPTSYDRLQHAAAEGPVIMLVPRKEGSTALVIRNHAPICRIILPGATSDRLAELSHNFTDALNYKDYNDAQRERECVDNLACLWNEVVGPIAHALQHDLKVPLRSRVWWCPASVACFLPLHAAGLYSKAKAGETFPNMYISSYTPTLQALVRARRSNSTAPKKLLVISQPQTPGEPPLPYARVEADTIAKIVSSAGIEPLLTVTPLLSAAGTREAVQHEMASHPWIHFICHGVQKVNQPLESHLSLHDGPLTLREIIEQNLPNADFAFLAACHSAAGDKDLANEALHLSAAMQFAGFRGVVGTLWKMRDVDGPPLAEAFYKDMTKHGDHRRAAVALSKAINQLRRNKVPIHCWMRFIHIGA